jgi:hypothetical protein
MSPELLQLIETVYLESLKIIGPAIIAAYAAHKATKLQYETKLLELEKGHEFKARENLHSYYKERQAKGVLPPIWQFHISNGAKSLDV